MATATTVDEVLDGMVTALGDLMPVSGTAVTSNRPLRSVGRYTGRFALPESNLDGAGGRTPAVQVAFDSEQRVKTVTSRRTDKVKGTYVAYCITDKRKNRDSRAVVMAMTELVRKRLGAHAFGLPIRPLEWQSRRLTLDTDLALAYAVTFTSVYRVDYTIEPGNDVLESASGDVTDETADRVYLEVDTAFEETA